METKHSKGTVLIWMSSFFFGFAVLFGLAAVSSAGPKEPVMFSAITVLCIGFGVGWVWHGLELRKGKGGP